MTKYERNPTYTREQTSLGIKAIGAMLINSILIPIMVNKFLKDNLYGEDGLSDTVFFFAITNSFIMPILKIFDPNYLLLKLLKKYYNSPNVKLEMNQN